VVSHPTAIQLAISNTVPPIAGENFMTIDATNGVVISKSLQATAGLSVSGGDINCNNRFNINGGIYSNRNCFVMLSALVSGHQI
jgi:hypothetical protein